MGALQRGEVKPGPRGTWAVRYYLPNGYRRQEGGFPTKGAAQRHLRDMLSQIDNGLRGDLSLSALTSRWLHVYDAAPATQARVRGQVALINAGVGSVLVRSLTPEQVAAFRMTVSEGQRHQVHGLLRQIIEAGVRWGYATTNPAKLVPNPAPKRGEVAIFRDWAQVESVAHEIGEYGPLVVFAAGTGLRPSEWAALDHRDIDVTGRVVTVHRSYTERGGMLDYGKTAGSRRRVPLRSRVIAALDIPARGLAFPAYRGGPITLHNWRPRYWLPALEAAGLPPLRPYALRHTYAAWSLAAGVGVFTLARRMGTSVEMINATYGHLVHDAESAEVETLDAWDDGH